MSPMMLAHTRLLVPKTLPKSREAEISRANVTMPAMKTARVSRRLYGRSKEIGASGCATAQISGRLAERPLQRLPATDYAHRDARIRQGQRQVACGHA